MIEDFDYEYYGNARKRVLEKLKVKQTPYGTILAAFAHTQEEYDLIMDYMKGRYYSDTDIYLGRAEVSGKFEGPDWYFLEEYSDYLGMEGTIYTYEIVSLSEKKRKFEEFCKEYEM